MATISTGRRRSNSLKAEEEYDLYRLLTRVANRFKRRFKLKGFAIRKSLREIRNQHRSWRKRAFSGINYDDYNMCCAYLMNFAICHAALARHATLWFLQKICSPKSGIKELLFKRDSLKVVCVGGGPGNGLLGFCSAVEGTERTFKELELTVVELESGWGKVFKGVMATAKSAAFGKTGILLQDENVNVRFKFVQADLTCEMVDEIKQADLILMVKVLTNVPTSKRSKMLKNIFSAMKQDAIFFCVDLLSSKVRKQASKPRSNISILFTKKRHSFRLSIGENKLKNAILKSAYYEICVCKKTVVLSTPLLMTEETKEVRAVEERNSDDQWRLVIRGRRAKAPPKNLV